MTMYEMVKDDPNFKRFCASQSTRPLPKPKRFKVPIPIRKGVNSLLGEYTTGRLLIGNYSRVEETLKLKKINGEVISEEPSQGETQSQGVSTFWIDLRIAALESENARLRKKKAA